jgi:hemerythrin-like domain-containing protein
VQILRSNANHSWRPGLLVSQSRRLKQSNEMDPLKSLSVEHAVIAKALEALEGYLERISAGELAAPSELGRFAAFFAKFADLNHHEKEEDLLLPTLERAGLAWDSAAVQGVRSDHRQERYLVSELNDSWPREGDWTPENRRHVVSIGNEFITFQRKHMSLEESEVMTLAARMLNAEQLIELEKKFSEFDEYFGRERYEELVGSAESLFRQYGDPTRETLV